MDDYSTKNISPILLLEIKKALKSVDNFGSIEIYVNDGIVTQVTVRNIKKTTGRSQHKSLWGLETWQGKNWKVYIKY